MPPRDIWEERREALLKLLTVRKVIEGFPIDVMDETRRRAAHCLVSPAEFEMRVNMVCRFAWYYAMWKNPAPLRRMLDKERWLEPMIEYLCQNAPKDS